MSDKKTIFLIKNKIGEDYWCDSYEIQNLKDGFYFSFQIKTKTGNIQKFLLPKENLSVIVEQDIERVIHEE